MFVLTLHQISISLIVNLIPLLSPSSSITCKITLLAGQTSKVRLHVSFFFS